MGREYVQLTRPIAKTKQHIDYDMKTYHLEYSTLNCSVDAPSLLAALVSAEYYYNLIPDDCKQAYEIYKGYKQPIPADVISDLCDVCHLYRKQIKEQDKGGQASC